ncbi:hypothetical protein [Saccharothrix obliqua]|uniref:hypothetical protein n=1 Tax=Saccharothrix obliqua TaxID=2861747 RepID=UPI001C5F5600|nr:hypothetical protein [Saccharothrix obliqua]MBW4720649.1 hypothetical protein [Saccharothrix obliqua]
MRRPPHQTPATPRTTHTTANRPATTRSPPDVRRPPHQTPATPRTTHTTANRPATTPGGREPPATARDTRGYEEETTWLT